MTTIPHQTQVAIPPRAQVAVPRPPAPSAVAGPQTMAIIPSCPGAGRSFAVGLVALRVCWLPGVNCVLAIVAVVLGTMAIWQILHSRGTMGGLDEAISGTTLGVVVLGLSVFFTSALVAAWRR